MMQIQVRQALASDGQAIPGVILAAFGEAQGGEIVDLVFDLLEDQSAQPLVSLVSSVDDQVVGHILFTSAHIQSPARKVPASILAPLAVHPNYQGRGVGGRIGVRARPSRLLSPAWLFSGRGEGLRRALSDPARRRRRMDGAGTPPGAHRACGRAGDLRTGARRSQALARMRQEAVAYKATASYFF